MPPRTPERAVVDPVEVVDIWSDRMRAIVQSRARQRTWPAWVEADDLAQEAWLGLIEWSLATGSTAIRKPLLNRIVRNRMLGYAWSFRRANRRLTDSDANAYAVATAEAPEADPDLHADVRRALGRLTPRQRRSIVATYFGCVPLAATAAATGRTYAQAKNLNFAAFKALRAALAAGYGPTPDQTPRRPNDRARKRNRQRNEVDWSKWGPIPNQRKDDDDG